MQRYDHSRALLSKDTLVTFYYVHNTKDHTERYFHKTLIYIQFRSILQFQHCNSDLVFPSTALHHVACCVSHHPSYPVLMCSACIVESDTRSSCYPFGCSDKTATPILLRRALIPSPHCFQPSKNYFVFHCLSRTFQSKYSLNFFQQALSILDKFSFTHIVL